MDFQQFLTKFQKVEVEEYQNDVPNDVLVSVCVQTFRHARYIRECLDGILMQKADFNFELLLGEDESDDGTREICLEYAEKYPERIRLFLHSRKNNIFKHGAPSSTFNLLYNLFSSRGKYLAFCEGDDYWVDAAKLDKQITILEADVDVGLSFHRIQIERNGLRKLGSLHPHEIPFENLVKQRLAYTPSMVLRNDRFSVLPSWMTDIPYLDYSFSLLATVGRKAAFLPDPMAVYRVHSRGMSSGADPIKANSLSILALDTCREHFQPEARKEFRFRRAYLLADLCFKHFDLGNIREFKDCYRENSSEIQILPIRTRLALLLRKMVSSSDLLFRLYRTVRT
ncbi:MAG: glycosyltransferase [Acidobacteriota bacterium]|nr:MAG: glycosyltransferase [Acidobacteriota bacterium]